MKNKLYYQAPNENIFNEIKSEAIKIWETYDNAYGYVDEKVSRIKDLKNIRDNTMYIVAMFDVNNQQKLFIALSNKSRKAVAERIKSGGTPDYYNFFLI